MKRRMIAGSVIAMATAAALTGCVGASGGDAADSGEGGDAPAGEAFEGEVAGAITVLTNRTDLVDTTLADYAEQFEAEYPGTSVEFEGITNYEEDVTVRLSSQNYGDVLYIPNKVTPDQLPQFFEPLGTVDELGEDYRYVTEMSYEGDVYGLAAFGAAQGFVYNKNVWEQAGITEPPSTPAEFLEALGAIKESTDAIPYYTNYADSWPLSNWQNNSGSIGGPDIVSERNADDSPWDEGKDQEQIDGLLYDIVADGLAEDDPTTTNWEESKNLLGTGEVAAMALGSWAHPQMQAAAAAAGGSEDDIGFWPMPFQAGGAFQSVSRGDYKAGISKHSENKATAKAWLDWMNGESGYAQSQGGIPPRKDGELPEALSSFEDLGVELVEINPVAPGEESVDTDIQAAAQIDLVGANYRKKMIDIARGAADGDKRSYFAELNERWAEARDEVLGD